MPSWGFLELHSHSYAEQVECQISATKSEARELLGKAIELGGDAVKTQALEDPDLQGVWVSEEE